MTTKEKLLSEIETMPETEIAKLLSFADLIKRGVNIHGVCHGRPVVKESELSKLDLDAFFNDGFGITRQ